MAVVNSDITHTARVTVLRKDATCPHNRRIVAICSSLFHESHCRVCSLRQGSAACFETISLVAVSSPLVDKLVITDTSIVKSWKEPVQGHHHYRCTGQSRTHIRSVKRRAQWKRKLAQFTSDKFEWDALQIETIYSTVYVLSSFAKSCVFSEAQSSFLENLQPPR